MLDRIEQLYIQILRMEESSGNIQIFVRLKRKDDVGLFGETLEYNCFQTKHLDYKDCLERAWFSATSVCNFIGCTPEDIVITGLTNEDQETMKQGLSMFRGRKFK